MKNFATLVVLCLVASNAEAVGPVQKVIQLLGDLRAKIVAEGEVEQENFEEFSKWCDTVTIEKKHEIKDAAGDVESLSAEVEKNLAIRENSVTTVQDLGTKIAGRENDVKKASEIRKKEHADFSARDSELGSTIDMLVRAKRILSKNLTALMQISNMEDLTDTLSSLIDSSVISLHDKRKIAALLQNKDDVYESKSGGIVETLESLREKAVESKNAAEKDEMTAEFNYKLLAQSLKNEITSLNDQLNSAKSIGSAAQEAAGEAQGSLAESKNRLSVAKKYLADAESNCVSESAAYKNAVAGREGEVKVIDEASKILKNAGSAVSFLQISSVSSHLDSPSERQLRASRFVRKLADSLKSAALFQVANRVAEDPFKKVKGMIQNMVEKLTQEQAAEASHKAWCDEELAVTRTSLKKKTSHGERLQTKVDKAASTIGKLKKSVQILMGELETMNKAEAEATALRGKQKKEYSIVKLDLEQGLDAVSNAMQVLKDYYNGEDSSSSVGGQGASSGIIGLLETVETDLSRSLAEGNATESQAQQKFDKLVQDNRVDRASKQTAIEGKNAEVNRLESAKAENLADLNDVQKEAAALDNYLADVSGQCTTKVPTFEERQERRSKKIEGLNTALEILESETA